MAIQEGDLKLFWLEKDDDFGLELVLGSAGEGTQQSEMQDKAGEST